jgi:hypothetical protein
VAKATTVDMVNSAVRALVAALSGVVALQHDQHSETAGGISHTVLSKGKAKMGDAMNQIVCWVMHSKIYSDLEQQALSDKITNVADGVINIGKVGSLGIPAIITDSAPLLVSGTPDQYITLGLVSDAAVIEESEERTLVTEGPITGLANLFYRIQGEMAYNLGVKGFTWDYSHGGANPLDAAVATASNWDQIATSVKDCCGIYIYTD